MRLIDADVLYAKFLDGKADTAAEKEMNQVCRYLILHEPTIDAVPVVRCGECEYFGKNEENDTYCASPHGLSDPTQYDFCPYGERKGGAE